MPPFLQLDGVRKRYGETTVLDRLDLAVDAGRTTVLIGPSGCGKSTILRLLLALIRPDAGTVRFDGTPLEDRDAIRDARRRSGYVIQDGGLFPHLTGRGNVALPARRRGWEAARIDARIAELAHLTHLDAGALERFPAELSGGQQQRVALMRALVTDPAVLLLDEPLGALDPIVRYELQEELAAIIAQLGKTVVLVTHDLDEAGFFGDELVLLAGGRIVQRGPLETLLDDPAEPFVERFVRAQRGHRGTT